MARDTTEDMPEDMPEDMSDNMMEDTTGEAATGEEGDGRRTV